MKYFYTYYLSIQKYYTFGGGVVKTEIYKKSVITYKVINVYELS